MELGLGQLCVCVGEVLDTTCILESMFQLLEGLPLFYLTPKEVKTSIIHKTYFRWTFLVPTGE